MFFHGTKGVILPVYSDNTKYIEYIDVGESIELEYTVVADVDAEAGLYQLDLSCEFEDGNGGYREIKTQQQEFLWVEKLILMLFCYCQNSATGKFQGSG